MYLLHLSYPCYREHYDYSNQISAYILTTSVLLAQIRKPPDVAQTHAVSDDTEEELHFPAPCRPILLLVLLGVDDILVHHDCHVLGGLAVVVQGSQFMPIPRGLALDYHSL